MFNQQLKSLKININEFFCILTFIWLLYPQGLRNWSNSLFLIATIMDMIVFICLLIINISKTQVNFRSYFGFYFVMFVYFCVVQLICSPQTIIYMTRTELLPILESFFCIYWITREDYFRGIRLLANVGKAWLTLNFITVIIFPSGMFRSLNNSIVERVQWFFGSKNNQSILIVVCFGLIIIDMYLNNRNRNLLPRYIIYSIFALFPITMCGDNGLGIFMGSSTGMIAVFLLFVGGAIVLFLGDEKKHNFIDALFNPLFIFIGIAIANLILLFGLSGGLNSIITGIFGKSVTFSGRVGIWENAMKYISESPLFGYGRLIITYTTGATSVYSIVLRTIISYGFVGLVLFILTVFSSWISSKASFQIKRLYIVVIAAVFVVGMMSEVHISYVIFLTSLMYLYKDRPADRSVALVKGP